MIPARTLIPLVLAFWAAASQAQAPAPATPTRVALVVGNAAYASAPLPNAANDAADMAKALEAAGFTVILRRDAGLKDMHLALREFGDRLGRNATGLFYFAGHGMQVRGRNYLIPVDADIAREDEVAFSALDLGAVMEKLDTARNPVNLVILDACRNNPFAGRFQVAAKGLAQVEAPPGTLIAFATAPGSVAADGQGRNGLYTGQLLRHLARPGIAVEEVFKSTRADVRKASANQQVPWESTSLETSFAFRPAVARAEPKAPEVSRGLARVSSPGAPPTLAEGDRWTYRYRNLLDGSETRRTMSIKHIDGNDVQWSDGSTSDLFGNFTRNRMGEQWQTYTPAAHMYVFPLRRGAAFDLAFLQERGERRYDNQARIVVGAEEDVETPAGRFRAIRIEREVKWTRIGKPGDSGVSRWTYWYSAPAKRWVVAEATNTHDSGKVTSRERWDLESYSLR